jgi:hypothetical protein
MKARLATAGRHRHRLPGREAPNGAEHRRPGDDQRDPVSAADLAALVTDMHGVAARTLVTG